jgi:cysteine desulfurase / selenocysteine lyase
MNPSTLSPSLLANLDQIRADFPILRQTGRHGGPLVYLDNAATSQRPHQVIQAIVNVYEQHYANVHRGIHYFSDQTTDFYEEARNRIRDFIHAKESHEVIFTTGTTLGINLIAHTWGEKNLGTGDRILVSELEHHANLVPWHQLAERKGCHVDAISLRDDGSLDLDDFRRLLEMHPKLVAISAVSNVLGTVVPVQEIVRLAHDAGAVVVVDAAQAVPHEAVDVQSLGADFVAFSGHKMLGPSGIGILYGKEALLEKMPPFLGGGNMIRRVRIDGFESADLPAKFEAGTPPIASAIGLGAAVDYLSAIGLPAISQHVTALTRLAHERLAEIPGIRILGPDPTSNPKGPIVSFVFDKIHPHDVAQILDERGIAIRAGHHCAMPLHKRLGVQASSRASFYFYNTAEEVEALVEGLIYTRRVLRRE